jgi:hypothetical protein
MTISPSLRRQMMQLSNNKPPIAYRVMKLYRCTVICGDSIHSAVLFIRIKRHQTATSNTIPNVYSCDFTAHVARIATATIIVISVTA